MLLDLIKIIEIKKLLGGDVTRRWKDDNWGVFSVLNLHSYEDSDVIILEKY